MLKLLLVIVTLTCCVTQLSAQPKIEDLGYRQVSIKHQGAAIDLVVRSKKGESDKRKPVLILIRGSLAKPLVKFNKQSGHYPPFPFDQRIFLDRFHLVCIGKPGIPISASVSELNERGEYLDPSTGELPVQYTSNNHLDYYVVRNAKVIEHLVKQDWVDSSKIVVAGHSQGSDIAVGMADKIPGITHLIFSSGSPYFPTILDMIRKQRKRDEQQNEDRAESMFEFWEQVVESPLYPPQQSGWDANRTVASFSRSQNEKLKGLNMPVLITYGTEDTLAPFNDMFRVETIRARDKTIQFKAYLGAEHNYFGVTEKGKIDFDRFGWDDVARDWLHWLQNTSAHDAACGGQ